MSLRLHRSAARRPAFVLALALVTSLLPGTVPGSTARAADTDQDSGTMVSVHAPALKRLQRQILLQGAHARMARAKVLARQLRRHPDQVRPGAGVRRKGDWNEAGGPQGMGMYAPTARKATSTRVAAPLVPDVLVNDRADDNGFTAIGQCEQMIAAHGSNILVAWNDGLGFTTNPFSSLQGYGYSVNGGASFTDGGSPPVPAGWRWSSDPLVTVDEKTGDFWFCALVDDNATMNGIALVKGTFGAGAVQWGTPALVRSGSNALILFDKPWLAADSLSGRLYLSYTVFGVAADTIVFQRSSVGGTAWELPQRLSATAEAGYVQGSRPVVGPGGEVYVTWYSIGTTGVLDFMRVRKSVNQGVSFSAAVTAASLYSNFSSGAPGFNRGTGVTYPSIAVDRSHGAQRGRVYLAWNECVNFYDDNLGTTGSVSEAEINDATANANAFTPGKVLRGSLSSASDFDYFKFDGTAGQTVLFFADSLTATFSLSLRLYCSDGVTRLALSAPGTGLTNFICFTLPTSGTYYVRCASWDNSVGSYKISTGLDSPSAGERARDHRDAFATWSDAGSIWSTPARVSDSPAGYDDWLPEVAVGGDHLDARVGEGRPYCIWYDWRDSAALCGGGSHIYLSRSDDAGGSWAPVGVLSAVQTDWTNVASNIAPNQGDYLSLFADQTNLYAAWADGRNGDPDVYAATVPLLTTPVEVALASVEATPGRVALDWYATALGDQAVTVERRQPATGFAAIGTATAQGDGRLVFVDATVAPGSRYVYRLTWLEGAVRRTSAEVVVDVPVSAAFALDGARPNPASHGVFVSLALPDATPARLELLDVTGRRLGERPVTGAGPHLVNVSEGLALEPGIYLVRLTQGDRSLTARVTVVR